MELIGQIPGHLILSGALVSAMDNLSRVTAKFRLMALIGHQETRPLTAQLPGLSGTTTSMSLLVSVHLLCSLHWMQPGGILWRPGHGAVDGWIAGGVWDHNIYVAVGSGASSVFTSLDGRRWNSVNSGVFI